jgi:hypothetical protein
MSYPPPPYSAPPPVPGEVPRPPRPSTVTLAAAALVGEAVLLLVGAVASIAFSDSIKKAGDSYAAAHGGASSNSYGANTAFSIFFGLIFAIALVGLALGNLRGVNVVRIITWVVCGLLICCLGFSTILSAVVLGKYLSGGYLAYAYIVGFLQLVGYIATVVLLALPASNVYFRRPTQQPF